MSVPLPGSHTALIYGLIRDGKLTAAVERLQGVLRVSRRRRRQGGEAGGRYLPLFTSPPSPLSQVSPGTRAALSLLAHCYYQLEEYEAAATT